MNRTAWLEKNFSRVVAFILILVALLLAPRLIGRTAPDGAAQPLPDLPFIDMHCHTAGIGAGHSGCFVSEKLRASFKFHFYLKSFGVTEAELERDGDALVLARLSERLAHSTHVEKAVVLALDGVVDEHGNLDRARTEIYVPNEFLAAEIPKHPNLLWGASVNPYRPDALARLEWARAGDAVYVTGEIGMSGGGLAIFKRENHALSEVDRDALIARYRVPQPPVAFGAALRGRASAGVDVSDGLVADLSHLATASNIAITLEGEALPIPAYLKDWWGAGAIARAATAGDDYQIAFTADPARESEIRAFAKDTGVKIKRIGTVAAGEGVRLLVRGAEAALPRRGYRHF